MLRVVRDAEPKVLLETSAISVCVLDDLFLSHWFAPIDLDTFRSFASVQRGFAASRTGSYSTMSIVELERVGRMDEEAKAFSQDHLHKMAPRLTAMAQVLLGAGFVAATARAVVTGQSMLKRPTYAWKIFDAIDPGCAWIAERVEPDAATVRRAADRLMARGT